MIVLGGLIVFFLGLAVGYWAGLNDGYEDAYYYNGEEDEDEEDCSCES